MLKFLVLLFICHLFLVPPAAAHLAGQPPYLRINSKYTLLYPVPVSSAPNFNLPQDITQEVFLVGQVLNFALEVNRLPAPPEVVAKTNFTWDFGDNSPQHTGLKTSHIYNKPGSYFQTIYADDDTTSEPQLLSSVLINVVPDSSYRLPQPLIFVNELSPKDPITDPLVFNLTKNLEFDGSMSKAGSGKIISYSWDMGDGTTQNKAKFSFKYSGDVNQVFPVLRVQDENGLIADTFVELKPGNPAENLAVIKAAKNIQKPDFLDSASKVLLWVGLILGLVLAIIILVRKKRRRK